LEYLYIGNNNIHELPEEVFNLKKIKEINVTNNEMPNLLLDIYREKLAPSIKITF
jgi:Leucine-rich repeat (LRR) protein